MADDTSFCSSVELGRLTCSLPVVLLSYTESHFSPQHLVSCPAVSSTHGSGTVDVRLIPTPRYDEVDHMPVSGTRMHLGGSSFCLNMVFVTTLPILALKSPISSNLSVRGMPLSTLASLL